MEDKNVCLWYVSLLGVGLAGELSKKNIMMAFCGWPGIYKYASTVITC